MMLPLKAKGLLSAATVFLLLALAAEASKLTSLQHRRLLDSGIDLGGGRNIQAGGVECNTPGQSCSQTVVDGVRSPAASPGQSLQPGSASQQSQGIVNEGYGPGQASANKSPFYNTGAMCTGQGSTCTPGTQSPVSSSPQPAGLNTGGAPVVNSGVMCTGRGASCTSQSASSGSPASMSQPQGNAAAQPTGGSSSARSQTITCTGDSSCATSQGTGGTIVQNGVPVTAPAQQFSSNGSPSPTQQSSPSSSTGSTYTSSQTCADASRCSNQGPGQSTVQDNG